MSDIPLFRKAALEAHQTHLEGEIVLVRPISTQVFTLIGAIFACTIVAFLIWGSYTKRSTVAGQLMPDSGLVKIYSPQFGVVDQKRVTEGQQVEKGDILYVLSSERESGGLGSLQGAIATLLNSRRESLNEEIAKTRRFQEDERLSLSERIKGTEAELDKLDHLLDDQRSLVSLSQDRYDRYQRLVKQGHISHEQLQKTEEELLDQRARMQNVERDRIRLVQELQSRRDELAGLSLKHETQLAQLSRNISALDQELAENEAAREIAITAPEAGTVTALVAQVGQSVDGSRPLASIVPEGATMEAQLYAPSRAVGFVRVGDPVLLRYQAYPYQKFGHAKGQVRSVSKTALPANDLAAYGPVSGTTTNEPLYVITVALESQTIMAYGEPQPLQAGMLLDADILQDTRKLYEWVLEPLLSLTGKL